MYANDSQHAADVTEGQGMGTIATVITSSVLAVVILTTIIGNVFVIAAIMMERALRSVANYLIISLAVADLFVACLVMPLGAMYEITGSWKLGPVLCDMWTSADVLCCTASILHLLAIAMDRFWAVTNINYIQSRDSRRVLTMIFLVWTFAVTISVGPLFGWKDPSFNARMNVEYVCLVSQDIAYQIFATMASFYVPLAAILTLYWRIFQAARRRIRHKVGGGGGGAGGKTPRVANPAPPPPPAVAQDATEMSRLQPGSAQVDPENEVSVVTSALMEVPQAPDAGDKQLRPAESRRKPPRSRKETLEAKRERKAAKTLAIVTGAFIICWLPFFVTALVMPLCSHCYFSRVMTSIFLWLGWFNSTLNPIIYTIFSPDFRQAFKKILCGKASARSRNRF